MCDQIGVAEVKSDSNHSLWCIITNINVHPIPYSGAADPGVGRGGYLHIRVAARAGACSSSSSSSRVKHDIGEGADSDHTRQYICRICSVFPLVLIFVFSFRLFNNNNKLLKNNKI
jgi:hypothetical protein